MATSVRSREERRSAIHLDGEPQSERRWLPHDTLIAVADSSQATGGGAKGENETIDPQRSLLVGVHPM